MSQTNSRTLMLERIRRALNVHPDEARESRKVQEWQDLPRAYQRLGILDEDERVALFDERIREYNATTYYSSGNVAAGIQSILSARGKRILIAPFGFPSEWLPQGFMWIPDDNLTYSQLNSNDGVLTACTLAIALTGTIILQSSPEQGRRATSLIPDYHLCIVRRQDIVEIVPEAFRQLESVKNHPLTFVSGPSATVDIEMTRIRGVHGPRVLDVLII